MLILSRNVNERIMLSVKQDAVLAEAVELTKDCPADEAVIYRAGYLYGYLAACQVAVTVVGVRGTRVRLGIDAPATVAVHREEVYQRILSKSDEQNR